MDRNGFIVLAVDENSSNALQTTYGSCQVKLRLVNYGRIQEWLSDYETLHSESCGLEEELLPMSLRVIDCLTRDTIQVGADDGYFALSYVWGAPGSNPCSKVEQDRSKSPWHVVSQVIEDAMTVVKALGKLYFWVDKFCVDQQDHDARNLEIQNMDRIYAGAYATFVASASSNASFGLSGVG